MAVKAKKDEGRGYSIWLMPEEEMVFKDLHRAIKGISREYESPVFEPHITLMGTLLDSEKSVLENTEYLAGTILPYAATFGNIVQRNEYFRGLFVRIQKSPDVMEANRIANNVFGRSKTPEYMPHMSFMYSSLPRWVKEGITSKYALEAMVRRIDHFTISKLSVYSTEGKVKRWQRIEEFTLAKRN